MKSSVLLFFFVASSLNFLFAQEEESVMPNIIPMPQQITVKKTYFKIASTTKIVLGNDSKEEHFAAEQINDEIAELKDAELKVVGENSVRKLSSNYIFIGFPSSKFGKKLLKERKGTLTAAMKDEGYFLDADQNGVVIIAESNKGKFYGVMTLLQLLQKEKRSTIVPGIRIEDYPLEKVRGISDDISRGQVSTLENFKKIIRTIARYKLNTYSPYIEDMFAFQHYPSIGRTRGALTPQEVKELDVYAKKYCVDLIPTFETLGHWDNILSMPEYADLAEFPGAHTLNVSDPRVYTMLRTMIGELAGAFSSPYFNMAADESWDVGLGANKERVAKSDLATVHAEHYKKLFEIIRSFGKKPMMYGDVILNNPGILDKIPKDVIIVDWHYGASFGYPSAKVFHDAGFSFVASPAVWNFTGPFPNFINSLANIQNFNRDGYENGSLGLLTSTWNDNGGEELRELNYYGYAWTAECAWQPLRANAAEFNAAFFKDFFRLRNYSGGQAGTNDDEKLQTIYSILSDPANQYSWNELWRDPMLPLREQSVRESYLPFVLRVQSIQSSMPFVRSLIESSKEIAARNADQLSLLDFVARLNLWFAKKIPTQEEVKQLSGLADSAGANKDSLAAVIAAKCDDVVKDLESLKKDFRELWLKTNKEPNLELLMARYERQASYWREKIAEVKRGEFWVDPAIESKWIYHPNAHPMYQKHPRFGGLGKEDTTQVPMAFFRKTFVVPNGVKSAKLQLIGDTYDKLYVNGNFAGEVSARRSLSLGVESQRVKIFDVAKFLNDSTNVFAVEARNYSPTGSAGVNIYCELTLEGGSIQKILSDSTWKVSDVAPGRWMISSFNDSVWVNAAPKQYPSVVVRPNFSEGRTSWIEQ
ncbi:MAG: family 20 glycosylhydrolase [Bacteroidota bacterium]|nr:family 20 glycosylhydrolase [Bacteroidota bacterium]